MSEESKKKLEIYMHYYITQLGLKYSFHSPKLNLLGWGKPDIKLNTVGLYYLWKDIYIMPIEDFDHKEWAVKFNLELL